MPFFSVIIPLYNKENQINETLESVLRQTFTDFEVIIVNDGSTDNSLERVESFIDERIKIYSQENQGAAITRNIGIEKAKAEYIALIDADDTWEVNHLKEHYKSIQKFPNADLYSNAYRLKLIKNKTIDAIYNIEKPSKPVQIKDYFKASTIHPIAWTSSLVFKKQAMRDLGGFNPRIKSGQDLDILIKFGLHKEIIFNPKITCCYDKTVINSLSKENHQESKYKLFNSFKTYEKNNKSLAKYLTLNRYSLAIQCKFADNITTFKKLLSEIDQSQLNIKQKILLRLPSFVLKFMKKTHLFLTEKGFYISSYK